MTTQTARRTARQLAAAIHCSNAADRAHLTAYAATLGLGDALAAELARRGW